MKNITANYIVLCFFYVPILVFGSEFPESYIRNTQSVFKQGIEIDVSQLAAGSIMYAKLGEIPIWVYKRTSEDINQLKTTSLNQLADPNDGNINELIERQYYSTSDKALAQLIKYSDLRMQYPSYRSISNSYFVVAGFDPHSGCYLKFKKRKVKDNTNAIFYDPCTDAQYDSAGRVYKGTVKNFNRDDEVAKYNLILLPHKFTSTNKIFIGLLPKTPILPALESKHKDQYKTLSPTDRLMLAARMNDHVTIHQSMEAGANPHYQEIGKGSVIDSAIAGSSTNIVEMLLQIGVKPTRSSLEIAKKLNREDVIQLLE